MSIFDAIKSVITGQPSKTDGYRPPVALTQKQAADKYGPVNVAAKKWANEAKFMCLVPVPESIRQHMTNSSTKKPANSIYINADIAPALIQAFKLVEERGLQDELYTFDGCLNVRLVRGSGSDLSTHSYGLAIDINAIGNGLGEAPMINRDLVKCFTDAGWTWGGTFSRKDGMHFQIASGW